jgi:hypothetical protein
MASRRLTFASNPKRAVRTPIPDASGGLMMNEIAFINAGLQKVERQCQPPYRCRLFICDMGYIEFFDLEDRHFNLSAATMLAPSRVL